MFCPKCRKEYVNSITSCSACNISLSKTLIPEFVEYEEIYSTVDQGEIAFIKSLLIANVITFYFLGEHGLYVGIYLSPAKLMVKKDQAGTAKELLKEHYNL